MLKRKLHYFLIILFLLNGFIYSQAKDYRQLYRDLTKGITNEQEYQAKTSEFFNSLNNSELPLAIANISVEKHPNFIAYELFAPNSKRLNDKEFRNNLIKQLILKQNPSDFKVVLIDFILKNNIDDSKELEGLNNALFEIARDNELPDDLRSYATSHLGISKNYETNKKQLSELFASNNYAVINGASRSIKKILLDSKTSLAEKNYWTNILLEKVKQNSSNLHYIKQVIYTLGSTNSTEAKNTLLSLFNLNVATDPIITETLVYSLSSLADTQAYNTIFTGYSKYKQYKGFGAELTLKQFVSENNDIVAELYYNNDNESKLNFLRSVRLMKDENRIKYLERVKESLNSDSEVVRLECYKTLHFLLPHKEEIKLFNEFILDEKSKTVKDQVYFYIGE